MPSSLIIQLAGTSFKVAVTVPLAVGITGYVYLVNTISFHQRFFWAILANELKTINKASILLNEQHIIF